MWYSRYAWCNGPWD
ncbi:hypothetical protein [Loigolactobacillus backii]